MSSDTIGSEIEELIEYIERKLSSCFRLLGDLTLKDVTELKVYKKIPDSVRIVFDAVFILLNRDSEDESSNVVKMWIKRPQELLELIKGFDLMSRPLTTAQIERINSLYASYHNLTESLEKISTVAYALSFWVETYIDITYKYKRVLEIQADQINSIKN